MIPEFPQFKGLELSDKEDVEAHTKKFPPYSDFNFVSMWSWDIKGEMLISKLNGNLVVRFTDYLTGKPFFSFLGDNMVNETLETLIEFSKKEHGEDVLSLVPEKVYEYLKDNHDFSIEQDPDSYDYVYEVAHLANMHSWPQHTSGKHIRSVTKSFPNYKVSHMSIKDVDKESYLDVFRRWAISRGIDGISYANEFMAFRRIFNSGLEDLKVVSLFIGDVLVGFTIYEIISNEYAISHFAKTDKSHHKALTDVLNWEEAKILHAQGVKYYNWEQDLGIPGLRKSKEKYKPCMQFKKCDIRHK